MEVQACWGQEDCQQASRIFGIVYSKASQSLQDECTCSVNCFNGDKRGNQRELHDIVLLKGRGLQARPMLPLCGQGLWVKCLLLALNNIHGLVQNLQTCVSTKNGVLGRRSRRNMVWKGCLASPVGSRVSLDQGLQVTASDIQTALCKDDST